MADIEVKVSLNDFFDSWESREDLIVTIKHMMAEEVLKKLKRDPRWKELVGQRVKRIIENLNRETS